MRGTDGRFATIGWKAKKGKVATSYRKKEREAKHKDLKGGSVGIPSSGDTSLFFVGSTTP